MIFSARDTWFKQYKRRLVRKYMWRVTQRQLYCRDVFRTPATSKRSLWPLTILTKNFKCCGGPKSTSVLTKQEILKFLIKNIKNILVHILIFFMRYVMFFLYNVVARNASIFLLWKCTLQVCLPTRVSSAARSLATTFNGQPYLVALLWHKSLLERTSRRLFFSISNLNGRCHHHLTFSKRLPGGKLEDHDKTLLMETVKREMDQY